MRALTRLLLTALLALGFGLGRPVVAHAGGPDNAAIAVNTKDGSSLFKFAFAIHDAAQDVVDNGNAAVAIAQCNSCQTVAIAIEIVLVTGNPSTVTPTNLAYAYNQNCNFCDTFASAYQFVLGTGGPVHFTPDGRKQLEDIRKEIAKWGKDGLTPEEMRARLPDLIARVKQILATQLVPSGPGDQGNDQGDTTESDTNQQPVTTAPTTSTATTTTGGQSTSTPAGTTTGPGTTTTAPSTTTTTP